MTTKRKIKEITDIFEKQFLKNDRYGRKEIWLKFQRNFFQIISLEFQNKSEIAKDRDNLLKANCNKIRRKPAVKAIV